LQLWAIDEALGPVYAAHEQQRNSACQRALLMIPSAYSARLIDQAPAHQHVILKVLPVHIF
jgi:hypothetical protein